MTRRQANLVLASDTRSVADARRFVASTLQEWGCAGCVADATLLVSELVGNSVQHAQSSGEDPGLEGPRGGPPASDGQLGGSIEVVVALDAIGHVRVEVRDGDPLPPVPGTQRARAVGGRGLQIVASVAHDWGVVPLEDGKAVWFALATS